MIHHFLTLERVDYLTFLHVADKHDDLNWRATKEGKKWRQDHE